MYGRGLGYVIGLVYGLGLVYLGNFKLKYNVILIICDGDSNKGKDWERIK